MKTNMGKQSRLGSEKIYGGKGKIELVNCPNNETFCKEHLTVINKCYEASEQHRQDKNFQLSIETLKNAFDKTTELNQRQCIRCAELFRSTITESLEDIHEELEKMNSGFFGNKRYQTSLLVAKKTLMDFKNIKPDTTIQMDAPEETQSDDEIQKEVI